MECATTIKRLGGNQSSTSSDWHARNRATLSTFNFQLSTCFRIDPLLRAFLVITAVVVNAAARVFETRGGTRALQIIGAAVANHKVFVAFGVRAVDHFGGVGVADFTFGNNRRVDRIHIHT